LSYSNNGTITTISGTISRVFKSGSTKNGFYFYVNSSTAYLIVIPGREAQFTAGDSPNSAASFSYQDVVDVRLINMQLQMSG
jgi:hypothetical protein